MRIVKNNKRISVLGLIKFFAAIAIVYFSYTTYGSKYSLVALVAIGRVILFYYWIFYIQTFQKKEK